MLSLQVKTFLSQANLQSDVITIIGINVTFLVMVVASPVFTAEFISNNTIGPLAAIAAGFFAAPGATLARTVPGAAGLALGKKMTSTYRHLKGKGQGTNTEARDIQFRNRRS